MMASIKQLLARRRKWVVLAGGIGLLLVAALGAVAIVPAISPTAGANMADAIRGVAGPQVVADMESTSFAIQDAFNQFIAGLDGGKKAISLAQTQAATLPTPFVHVVAGGVNPASAVARGSTAQGNGKLAAITDQTNAVTAAPQIGWQPFGPMVNGSPAMAQTLLSLDPQRSYAGIALVRIDLSQLQLHAEPGYEEPSHATNVVSALPHMGQTPPSDLAHIVAAFNGGFKAVNGQYGMAVNGVTLLAPQVGLATVVIYKDGHVAIGTWGPDIVPTPDIVALRQNCPPIIEKGQVNPQVYQDVTALWGNTVGNRDITWRTGLGITQDGRYLIYAVGNATTVETLATALLQAGAYNAMQLDINHPYAHFVTYQSTGNPLSPRVAVPLLSQMESNPALYLVPNPRDYFYVTAP